MAFLGLVVSICAISNAAVLVSLQTPSFDGSIFPPYEFSYNNSTGTATPGFSDPSPTVDGFDTLTVEPGTNTVFNFPETFGQDTLETVNGLTGQILATSNTLTVAAGYVSFITSATFGPDGFLYATGTVNNSGFPVSIFRINPTFTNGGSATVTTYLTPAGIYPADIAFGPDNNLYFAGSTSGSDDIWKYNTSTSTLSTVADLGSATSDNVAGLAFGPNGNLYVAEYDYMGDTGNGVVEYTTGGTLVKTFLSANLNDIQFGPDGDLYGIANYNSDTEQVERFDGNTGAFLNDASTGLAGDPSGIAFVPEPASIGLLLLSIPLLTRKFRRQQRES